MKSKKINKVHALFIIQLILSLFIIFFTILGKGSIVSACFTLTFIITLILSFLLIFKSKLSRKQIFSFFILYMIIIISFGGVAYGGNTLTFSYYKKLIMFYSTIIFLFVVSKVNVNKKLIDSIMVINIIIAVIYICSYYILPRKYYAGGLTFNFSNSNLAAMFLLHTFMYSILATIYYRNKLLRIICLIVSSYIIYFILETKSRTCLISLLLFIFIFLFIQIRKVIKLNRLMITALILSPIIITCIYMLFIDNGLIGNFIFMESEGKSLYSRYEVWKHAINSFSSNPILGDYFGISGGTGMSQMHNTHLDILASYGSITFLLVMIYMIRIVININEQCNSEFQTNSIIAFLTIIVMGFGEAALFSGGVGMYILTCSFLLLARY